MHISITVLLFSATWVLLFHNSTILEGLGLRYGLSWSHSDTPHSVGLLWMSDRPIAKTSTCQHTTLQTDIHAAGGIRTCNRNKESTVYPHPRPHGHWDRLGFICSSQLTSLYQSVKCFSPPRNSAGYKILPNSKKYVCCRLSYKDSGQRLTFTAQQDYCVQMQCVFKAHWITT